MNNITEQFIDGLFALRQPLGIYTKLQARSAVGLSWCANRRKKSLEEKHPDLIVNTPSEVFLSGFAAHVLELDDGHRHGMIHLGASIVTAVLDAAKKENLKSDNVLRGIVMGYEVAVRC